MSDVDASCHMSIRSDVMRITFTVRADKADGMLRQAQKMQGLKTGIKAGSVHLVSKLRVYPPSQSKYKRTGTLKRKWTHRITNNGYMGLIGNNTKYMPRVQGDRQTPYFKRVWARHSIDYVVKKNYKSILNIVRNEIRKAMR